ncbi:SseB family protein [Actinomadura sp. KC216]|uniref:SseB family protein n=1 Tax=Actinomadura sp. KC216 TaxID=2530370 RepID=UPI001FB72559|nr:SseB family protein [Actinomadura sp. KC216]
MLEWSEFARRLGRELAGLERDTILIVRERDESRHYVQAMREPDRLYAEAVSNNFLEGPLLLTLADEEVMSEAGWRPPSEPAPRNWWTELPEFGTPGGMLSVTGVDFSRLADVMVTALRDVQGVRRPSDLVYESFHRHGTGLIELTDFGIDVADPSRVNKRRASSARTSGDLLADTGPLSSVSSVSSPGGTPPAPEGRPKADVDLLEPRLAEAKANGDNTAYFRLLANADLVLPATAPAVEDPDRAEFPTITIGSSTYVTVFTSPSALARTGDRHPGLYRRTSFARLASAWPDPTWRLAINWGLPSEVLLDSSVISRMDAGAGAAPSLAPDVPNPYGKVDPNALAGPNPVAGGTMPAVNGSAPAVDRPPVDRPHEDPHTAIDPYSTADLRAALGTGTGEPDSAVRESFPPEPAAPEPITPTPVAPKPAEPDPTEAESAPAESVQAENAAALPLGAPTNKQPPAGAQPPAGVPLRPPHGTRLWRSAGEGDQTPLAVYDAIGGVWAPVQSDAVPGPRTD